MTRSLLAALAAATALASAPATSNGQSVPQRDEVRVGEPTLTGRTVKTAGHLDLGPRFSGNRLVVQIRDDGLKTPAWRNPSDVVITVPEEAALQIPADPRFAFLGSTGNRSYVLPQVQDESIVWPGWNTQDPEIVERVARAVTWRLDRVTGPGRFALFFSDGFGDPEILFDSSKPVPQQFAIELGTHAHGNWAFSRPGVYRLEVTMTAPLKGEQTEAARAALQFAVGDTDPQAAFGAAPSESKGARTAASFEGDDAGATPWALFAAAAALVAVLVGLAIAGPRRSRAKQDPAS